MKNLLKGDMGYSLRYKNRTVNQILADAFPFSADLGVRATIFATITGISLGVIAALNKGKKWDNISMVIAICGGVVWISTQLNNINYKLDMLETKLQDQWTTRDMENWGLRLKMENPNIVIPDLDD